MFVERPTVDAVVDQSVEDLALLWNTRCVLQSSGHAALRHLARLDQRLRAHQDVCILAAQDGLRKLFEQLAEPTQSRLFAATAVSLEVRDREAFSRCLAVAEKVEVGVFALGSALRWVSADRLAGVVKELLSSDESSHQRLGLLACSGHGADPGQALLVALRSPDKELRGEAFRCVAELGRSEFVSEAVTAAGDASETVMLQAAFASVLCGNRGVGLEVLATAALTPGPDRATALRLILQAMTVTAAHGVLQSLAREPNDLRWLVQGSGIVGDSTYVPWLIGRMFDEQTARLAGEAFSLITGTDLALLDLERKPPENFESGPNDDPDDPNVDMDPDDGLPWPDPEKIEDWWSRNSNRFTPGERYFMGAPVTRAHCIEVLKNGYQRQRILAAHYLCLLDPGTPLFNTSAPAWRQQKLLAQMV